MKKISLIAAALLLPLLLEAQTRQVSLSECLESGSANDMGVRNAHLDVLSARELEKEAFWGYLPSVSAVGFGYDAIDPLVKITSGDILSGSDAANALNETIRSLAYENGIKPYYETAGYGYGVSISAIQPVYLGGIIVNANRLAKLGVQASQLQERIRIRDSRDSIETKYWRVVALQEKEKTLLEASSLLSEVEKDLRSAVGAGLATESDLLGVKLRAKELQAGMVQLRGGLKLLKMDLFNTCGLPYSFFELKDMVLSGSLEDNLPCPEEIFSGDSTAVRLDESRLLALNVEGAELKKKMEMGKYKPQVLVGANYGYNNLTGGERPDFNGLAFATVRIPISSLGKIGISSRKMDYEIQKARNERDFLDRQLELKYNMGRLEVESSWEQLGAARESVAVAEDALTHARSNFNAGYLTSSELLQAEFALRGEKEKLSDCLINYRCAVRAYTSLRENSR